MLQLLGRREFSGITLLTSRLSLTPSSSRATLVVTARSHRSVLVTRAGLKGKYKVAKAKTSINACVASHISRDCPGPAETTEAPVDAA